MQQLDPNKNATLIEAHCHYVDHSTGTLNSLLHTLSMATFRAASSNNPPAFYPTPATLLQRLRSCFEIEIQSKSSPQNIK